VEVVHRGTAALFLALLLAPALLPAQTAKEIDHNYQVWASVNTTARFTDRWGAVADFHVRRDDFLAEPSFYLVRTGAHLWVSEKLTLTLGYAHMWLPPSSDDLEEWSDENRVYQQVLYSGRAGRLAVLHRVRNEQRWKQKVVDGLPTDETVFSNRVRYLLSLALPVAARPRPLSLVLADEVLLQFGHSVVYNTFDQNRLFGGVKVALSKAWSFDLGYMQVFQQKASGYQYDLDHTLRWFFYWTPDSRPGGKGGHEPAGGDE